MADGSGWYFSGASTAKRVDLAEKPASFGLRDLGIATSLGALTVSLLGTRTAPTARAQSTSAAGQDHGRLMFAMDATASREPAWTEASRIQSEMFDAASTLGGLDVQLVYFRGLCDFSASAWYHDAKSLRDQMKGVRCLSGQTQLRRVLSHAIKETRSHRVNALIYVGDAVEEDSGRLRGLAGELGMLGVPVFVFHELGDEAQGPQTAATFREIARLTGGAYCPFDRFSADQLRALLRAVAVFAVGGRLALQDLRPERQRAVAARAGDDSFAAAGFGGLVGSFFQQIYGRQGA